MSIKKASTIQDVANKAKVSIKTVSRVINNEPNVSLETVKKVETAIDLLDYQPNAFAQSLARSKPKIISLINGDNQTIKNAKTKLVHSCKIHTVENTSIFSSSFSVI